MLRTRMTTLAFILSELSSSDVKAKMPSIVNTVRNIFNFHETIRFCRRGRDNVS